MRYNGGMPRKKKVMVGVGTEPVPANRTGRDPDTLRQLNPSGMPVAADPGPHAWAADPDCPQVLRDLLHVHRRPRQRGETQEQRFLRKLRVQKPKDFLSMLRAEEHAFRAVLKGRAAAAAPAEVKVEERPEADAGAAAALGLIRRLLEAKPWEHS